MDEIEIGEATTAEREWCARLMAATEPWITLGRGLDVLLPAALDPALNFTLTPPVAVGTASRVFEGVAAGIYLVGENGPPSGFNLQSIACVDPSGGTVPHAPSGTASSWLATWSASASGAGKKPRPARPKVVSRALS